MAGIDESSPLGLGLAAEERGITTEQQLGATRAMRGTIGDVSQVNLDQGRNLGKELDSSVVEFRTQQKAFVAGMEVMATETSRVNANLNTFTKKLEDAVTALERYTEKTLDNER